MKLNSSQPFSHRLESLLEGSTRFGVVIPLFRRQQVKHLCRAIFSILPVCLFLWSVLSTMSLIRSIMENRDQIKGYPITMWPLNQTNWAQKMQIWYQTEISSVATQRKIAHPIGASHICQSCLHQWSSPPAKWGTLDGNCMCLGRNYSTEFDNVLSTT